MRRGRIIREGTKDVVPSPMIFKYRRTPEEGEYICPKCGQVLSEDVDFCSNCGFQNAKNSRKPN